MYHPTAFLPPWFLTRNWLFTLLRFPVIFQFLKYFYLSIIGIQSYIGCINFRCTIFFLMSCFSLTAFKISVFSFQQSDYNVSWYVSLSLSYWNLLSFLDLQIHSFIKFGVIISSNIFPVSFSLLLLRLPQYVCWYILWYPIGPLDSMSLHCFLFLHLRLGQFYCPILKFTDSFFCLFYSDVEPQQ